MVSIRAQKIKFLILMVCAFLLFSWSSIKKVVTQKPLLKVAVFSQNSFPASNTPKNAGPEIFVEFLDGKHPYKILDSKQLADYESLNASQTDILILPYGESFPVEAFDNIQEFVAGGGGLFTTGGVPFSNPVKLVDGKWIKDKQAAENFDQLFLKPLGIRYYKESTQADNLASSWPDFMDAPATSGKLSVQAGCSVTTSQGWFAIIPTLGNVFPARIPVRDFIPVLQTNKNGKPSASGLTLVKSWENPYRPGEKIPAKWFLCTLSPELNPISPATKGVFWNLRKIFAFLACPVLMKRVQPNLACYERGEKPEISVSLKNTKPQKQKINLTVNITDQSGVSVFSQTTTQHLASFENLNVKISVLPEKLKNDDYFTVTATLHFNSMLVDKARNAILFKPQKAPELKLSVKGKNFAINGKKVFLKGANYYESKKGELNWLIPDIETINEDFETMAAAGAKMVRVHYHPPRWFWDRSVELDEKLSTEFVADKPANIPSEKYLRILDAHIILANRHGMIFCPDIFTLVPTAMGSPRGWLGLTQRIMDKEKIAIQNEFAAMLAKRYKNVSGISWDLWNEPKVNEKSIPLLKNWVQEKAKILKHSKDLHLVTLGGNQSKDVAEYIDYICVHTDDPKGQKLPQTPKPILLQEVWLDYGNNAEEEQKQAQRLTMDMDFAKENTAGYMPWQWTRQARLWNCFGDAEKWDDELGCISRADGTLKPSFEIFSAEKYNWKQL